MFEPEFAGLYHRAPRPFARFVFIDCRIIFYFKNGRTAAVVRVSPKLTEYRQK